MAITSDLNISKSSALARYSRKTPLIGNGSHPGPTLFRPSFDAYLRLEDARAAALGTLPRLRQLSLVEGKTAGFAACRQDPNAMARRPGRADRMAEVVFDVAAREPQLPRQ